MTPGPIEESGKVAIGIVESLKNQPMVLAIILLNALILGLVFWGIGEQRTEAAAQTRSMLTQIDRAQELLSKCVVPPTP
jgi:uncharacterized protein HemX